MIIPSFTPSNKRQHVGKNDNLLFLSINVCFLPFLSSLQGFSGRLWKASGEQLLLWDSAVSLPCRVICQYLLQRDQESLLWRHFVRDNGNFTCLIQKFQNPPLCSSETKSVEMDEQEGSAKRRWQLDSSKCSRKWAIYMKNKKPCAVWSPNSGWQQKLFLYE